MSRNPEHQFFDTDAGRLLTDLITIYEHIVNVTVEPGSPERAYIQWVATVIVYVLSLANRAGNQNLPSRAEYEDLDALGELFQNLVRPGAKPSTSVVRFTISGAQPAITPIPLGTRVTDVSGAVTWSTSEDSHIPVGGTYADVPVTCLIYGVAGNGFVPGQISTLVDVSNIPQFERCENITVSDGGAEAATDEEYYDLMRLSQDSHNTAGAMGSYIYHAMKVSTEIAGAVANSPSGGVANLYVLMNDGSIAGEEIKAAVYKACNPDEVRPLTDLVEVVDAETVDYNIDFTYYLTRNTQLSFEEIEAAVNAAVDEYIGWQHGAFGRDINPDELRHLVRLTGGVKRVEIREPVFTVLRGGLDTDVNKQPQVAAAVNVEAVNGGYEDE